MTTGGDGRIRLDLTTGLNPYLSAPRPSSILAYASSTANDISPAAFARAELLLAEIGQTLTAGDYSRRLEGFRQRLRAAYRLKDDVAIVFAPSGTDLEYVALACVAGRGAGIHNILLGADEVGTGCIQSARGHYFAESTALGIATVAGRAVSGLGDVNVDLVDIAVRDSKGQVRPSAEIAERMESSLRTAHAQQRHCLIHVVHGSKTGLILPREPELDRLQSGHGRRSTLVVDACQARITSEAV
ncbi:MAG: hypothetical protein ACXW2T_05005, partial [Allosphingosinicella sp.]